MAVGQRVFIDVAGSRSGSVVLADESGKVLSTVHLADGFEVEVVAWRPRGPSDTRYRIRTPEGVDGWLSANNLRAALVPLPAHESPAAAGPTSVTDPEGRPFGQRSRSEVSLASVASGSAMPAPPSSVPGGGRRFGQHF